MKIFYIDLFSGAGGTTTGIHLANKNIEVVACVNHDAKAIESHAANHPNCLHFVEDVRDMKVVIRLKTLVKSLRKKYPDCVINLWASLECTNFSNAKGGLPREADSRTLAYALYDYIEKLSPDFIMIENVREFMSWGPLDEKGKPVSKLNGRDYIHWINKMCNYGYTYDWKMLNSADFGAYTSRERYFGQFAKKGLSIKWPEKTHSKKIRKGGLFENDLKQWKPVREVLDLTDEGKSIFARKKPLVEATLERIYAGLEKFVSSGEDEFIQKHFSGRPKGKVISTNQPTGALTTTANQSIVRACYLTSYYGNGGSHDVNKPCPTITTKDRFTYVTPQFIDNQFGNGYPSSIEKPNGALMVNPKQSLVSVNTLVKKSVFLMNPQFKDKGRSINRPSFTLIAKMDKRPPYLITSEKGKSNIAILKDDSQTLKKIKEFMLLNGIIDIKMRMLKVSELLKIQGFPEDYILKGTQADQKKFIGNSVVPVVSKEIANANAKSLLKTRIYEKAS